MVAPRSRLPRNSGLASDAPLNNARFGTQTREEIRNRLPDLFSAAQTAPFEADQAYQLVTGIYRYYEIFAIILAVPIAYAIDKQSLDIRLQFVQDRVIPDKLVPSLQAE